MLIADRARGSANRPLPDRASDRDGARPGPDESPRPPTRNRDREIRTSPDWLEVQGIFSARISRAFRFRRLTSHHRWCPPPHRRSIEAMREHRAKNGSDREGSPRRRVVREFRANTKVTTKADGPRPPLSFCESISLHFTFSMPAALPRSRSVRWPGG